MKQESGFSRPASAISACEICSQLEEVETSFSKYGWDDMTRSLPPAAGRLVPTEDIKGYDQERHHVRRCPICGTFYQYDLTYEYLVNGSEDEEELTRLTPTQAQRFLSTAEYDALIESANYFLGHPSVLTRRYAAKCLVSHYLARQDSEPIGLLLGSKDAAVIDGALAFLARNISGAGMLPDLEMRCKELKKLCTDRDETIAGRAGYVLSELRKLANWSGK